MSIRALLSRSGRLTVRLMVGLCLAALTLWALLEFFRNL